LPERNHAGKRRAGPVQGEQRAKAGVSLKYAQGVLKERLIVITNIVTKVRVEVSDP
jgi:hypothetical protein